MRLSPHAPWADPENTLWNTQRFTGDLSSEAAHESINRLGKSSPRWQVGSMFLDTIARTPLILRLVGFESHVKYLAITQKSISIPREKTDEQCLPPERNAQHVAFSLPLLHKVTHYGKHNLHKRT